MAEKHLQRKLVQISYSPELVTGKTISVRSAADVELLVTVNDGLCQVSYPQEFSGPAEIVIVGSKDGEDTANFEVE